MLYVAVIASIFFAFIQMFVGTTASDHPRPCSHRVEKGWAGGGEGAASGLRDAMAAGPIPSVRPCPNGRDLASNGRTPS
jgi:hypothetical protein